MCIYNDAFENMNICTNMHYMFISLCSYKDIHAHNLVVDLPTYLHDSVGNCVCACMKHPKLLNVLLEETRLFKKPHVWTGFE